MKFNQVNNNGGNVVNNVPDNIRYSPTFSGPEDCATNVLKLHLIRISESIDNNKEQIGKLEAQICNLANEITDLEQRKFILQEAIERLQEAK